MAKEATAANFTSVLDMPSTSIEAPKPAPVGTYIGVVQGLPRIDKSTQKKTEYSEYTLKYLSAMPDVDEEALEAWGGLKEKTTRVTFYHTPDAIFRLKKFLNDLDIPEEEDGEELTIRQRMMMVPNRQVKFSIKHTMSDDGQVTYANVGNTAKVDE